MLDLMAVSNPLFPFSHLMPLCHGKILNFGEFRTSQIGIPLWAIFVFAHDCSFIIPRILFAWSLTIAFHIITNCGADFVLQVLRPWTIAVVPMKRKRNLGCKCVGNERLSMMKKEETKIYRSFSSAAVDSGLRGYRSCKTAGSYTTFNEYLGRFCQWRKMWRRSSQLCTVLWLRLHSGLPR